MTRLDKRTILDWQVCSLDNLPNDMEEVLTSSSCGRGVMLCDFNKGLEGDIETDSYFQPDGGYMYPVEDIQFWARVVVPKEDSDVPTE